MPNDHNTCLCALPVNESGKRFSGTVIRAIDLDPQLVDGALHFFVGLLLKIRHDGVFHPAFPVVGLAHPAPWVLAAEPEVPPPMVAEGNGKRIAAALD